MKCLASDVSYLQPSTFNLQPSTLNPQPSTLNPQPSTLNPQPTLSQAAATPAHGPIDGPLSRRSVLTACTAAGLTGLCALYSATVSPFIQPGKSSVVDIKATAAPPPPPENVRMAKQYLPQQPWAETAKYQIRTPEAFIFANEWQPVENDQAVMFRPFAMIHFRENQPEDQTPITVVGESAYLRFSKKFDMGDADPGRIIAGALQGNSRITGPDNLVIVGRNFTFSEESKRLWSESEVTFQWGQHRGKGFGLQVELISDESAKKRSSIAVTGVQSLKLRRSVAVDMTFDGSDRNRLPLAGADPTPVSDDPRRARTGKGEAIEVRVRCRGMFEFDVEANVATFHDNVRVHRPTGTDKARATESFDSLQCDTLALMLEPKHVVDAVARAASETKTEAFEGQHVPSEPKAPDLAANRELKDGQREGNFGNLDTRMTLRQLRARSKPGEHVILISSENDLTARMTDLIYDVPLRKASMSNPDPEGVHVLQGPSEIRSPGMTLIHDAQGRLTSVWCQGPGWLKHKNLDRNTLELKAEWAQQLRKYADPETKLDVIELEKQAIVRQPEQKTGLAANFIRLWVDPQDLQARRKGEGRRRGSNRIRMRQMLALHEVALVSPEMTGSTDRLEVAFEELPPGTVIPGSKPAKGNRAKDARANEATSQRRPAPLGDRVALTNYSISDDEPASETSAARGVAGQKRSVGTAKVEGPATLSRTRAASPDPEAAAAEVPAKDDASREREKTPIDVEADLIRVRVLLGPGQRDTHIAEVWTEGNVEVTQKHGESEEPLKVTGDWMHVENPTRNQNDQVLHVRGKNAHVRDRGMHIEGTNVHMDRSRNMAWVDGAGLLQLPVDRTLDGQKLEDKQLLDVWWNERMTFNGLMAQFHGNVKCVLKDSNILCQSMDVTLTEAIRFSETRNARPEVKRVDCRDGVKFDGKEYVESRATEHREGEVAEFSYDRTTGRTTAHGPGWMRFWRRGNARRTIVGPGLGGGSSPAPRPTQADPNAWDFTRVDFAGASEGNVNERYTTFKDRVEIVHGRVQRPPEVIDPDKLPKDGGWMRCDQLRLQQHILAAKPSDKSDDKKKRGTQGHVEVLGSGNAEVEGRTFHGRADQISYDQSKDLYILKSFGKHKSTVSRQRFEGDEESSMSGAVIEMVPSRRHFKATEVSGTQGQQ